MKIFLFLALPDFSKPAFKLYKDSCNSSCHSTVLLRLVANKTERKFVQQYEGYIKLSRLKKCQGNVHGHHELPCCQNKGKLVLVNKGVKNLEIFVYEESLVSCFFFFFGLLMRFCVPVHENRTKSCMGNT